MEASKMKPKPAGIFTTPQGLDFYYNCPAGVHVWDTRKVFSFVYMECLICGALDAGILGREHLNELLNLEKLERDQKR